MAEQVTIVCDGIVRGKLCPQPPDAYVITVPDGTVWRVDLCVTHATPLLALVEIGRPDVKPRRRGIKKTEIRPL